MVQVGKPVTAPQTSRDTSCAGGAPVLELQSVTVSYLVGDRLRPAVQDVSLTLQEGGFIAMVGPSGCGKTTVLHAAAGLIQPSGGTVTYRGRRWQGLHPDIGYVTQKDTLLPWRNVVDNIALPLELKGVGKRQRREQAAAMAERLQLGSSLRHFPAQLSGGMRQRVQLGRTLISEPALLLMDEPFGALDAYLRLRMQELLRAVLSEHRPSILFVTHDLPEAIALSDEVVALQGTPGRVGLRRAIGDFCDRGDIMAMRADARFRELEGELWRTISPA